MVTSFGLVVICTWIAYEQWGRFATRGHGVMQKLRSQLGSPAVPGIENITEQTQDPGADANANSGSSAPDPENQRPVRRKTETSELQRMKAGVMTTVRDAARALIRGIQPISINPPEMHTLVDWSTVAPRISPFSLLFNQQIKVLGRTQGEVRDLEFSHDGQLLAVTRSADELFFWVP
jgi:hypothetical protein